MKKYLFFIFTVLFFTSCDKSFETNSPFEYKNNSSKIEGACISHIDCKSKSCDIQKKRCLPDPCINQCLNNGVCDVNINNGKAFCSCNDNYFEKKENNILKCINPCDNIQCSGHGDCKAKSLTDIECNCSTNISGTIQYIDDGNGNCISDCDNKENCGGNGICNFSESKNAFCTCNLGYQDNDGDLVCKKSCNFEEICENGRICNDSTGVVNCNCDKENNWYQNNNYKCINKCNEINCYGVQEKCIASNAYEARCVCNDNYFKNEDGICVSPCEGVDCNNHGICEVDENHKAYCNCKENYQDNNEDLKCNPTCNDNDCRNGSCKYYNDINDINAIILDNNNEFIGKKYCSCDIGYQDSNYDLKCNISCDNNIFICENHGYCKTNQNQNGLINCLCPYGYILNDSQNGCIWKGYDTKTIGGTNFDTAHFIIKDSHNNIYVSGTFMESVDFDPSINIDIHQSKGEKDIFITKFNNNGNYIWTKTIGGIGEDQIDSITIDLDDNLYLLGTFKENVDFDPSIGVDIYTAEGERDLFITKLSNNGVYNWTKIINGELNDGDLGTANRKLGNLITTDSHNNIYITGNFTGIINFDKFITNDSHTSNGNATKDIFLTKINNDGTYKWTKTMGGELNDSAYSIKIDNNDNIYMVGTFSSSVDFNPDNNTDIHTSNGYKDIFLTKFNNNGIYEWTKTMGGNRDVFLNSIFIKDDIYLAGDFLNSVDFNLSSNIDQHASNGNKDIFITKLNIDGDYNWTKTMGGVNQDIAYSILLDSNENIFTTGEFRSTVYFSPEGTISNGMNDIFIYKIIQNEPNCNNINCGNGMCQMDENNNTECICNDGYQDKDKDLFCEESCELNSCGIHSYCDDSNGNIFCYCNRGFTLNENNICVNKDKEEIITIGGTGSDQAYSIVSDSNNNIYMVGSFQNSVDFDFSENIDIHTAGNYNYNIFITKINNDGTYEWTKTIGEGSSVAYSITVDNNDNLFITGSFQNSVDFDFSENTDIHTAIGGTDIFVTKINSDGSYAWTKTMKGTEYSFAKSITVDSNNNVYITGKFKDSVNFNFEISSETKVSNGAEDIFITKINNDGSYGWTKTIGGTGSDWGNSIVSDNNNNIYITGYFLGIIDFNFDEGIDEHISNGSRDIFIVKINNDGSYGWTKTIGGIGNDISNSIFSYENNIYITGLFAKTVDFNPNNGIDEHTSNAGSDIFITKINTDGSYVWTKTIDGSGYTDQGSSIFIQEDNIYITGDFDRIIRFNDNNSHICKNNDNSIFILKLDSNGNYRWSKSIGNKDEGNKKSNTIILNSNKDIYIAGAFHQTVDFDSTNKINEFTSNGGRDIFIWKLPFITCNNITCNINEHCITQESSGCICNNGYHLNNDYECVEN